MNLYTRRVAAPASRRQPYRRLKQVGVLGFLFFFAKGMVWLAAAAWMLW
ncbi:MAG: hypothetical protein P8Y64_11940 [Gammaproteobacteria bacterium]|jgi:hypothetical protein